MNRKKLLFVAAMFLSVVALSTLSAAFFGNRDFAHGAQEQDLIQLEQAVFAGDISKVKRFIKKGVPLTVDPLVVAVLRNNLEMVQLLVTAGAPLSPTDPYASNPLHRAVGKGYIEIAKYLVQHGANANRREISGATGLSSALESGNNRQNKFELVKLLVENGADVNLRPRPDELLSDCNATHLQQAVSTFRLDITQYLLDRGADPTMKDKKGRTALECARHQMEVTQAQRDKTYMQELIELLIRYEQKARVR